MRRGPQLAVPTIRVRRFAAAPFAGRASRDAPTGSEETRAYSGSS